MAARVFNKRKRNLTIDAFKEKANISSKENEMLAKQVFIAVIFHLSFFTLSHAQESTAEDKYRTVLLKHVKETIRPIFLSSPDAKGMTPSEQEEFIIEAAQATAECHMIAMREYSPELSRIAYATALTTGSYLEAKHAFEVALAKEGAAGGAREENVKKIIGRAIDAAKSCLDKLNE